MGFLSDLFEPPYYAVIFSALKTSEDAAGYVDTAARMTELAATSEGYLGIETIRHGPSTITVSYWRDEAAITRWRENVEHAEARRNGRETWYEDFRIRIAKVERSYGLAPKSSQDVEGRV